MKIALYYPWVYLPSGAERSILALTGCSRHEWTIFTHRFEPENTFPDFRNRRVVEFPRVSVRRSLGGVVRASARIARQRLPLDDFDALLVVSEGIGDLIVFRNSHLPTLCVCLTPLRIACDASYAESHFRNVPTWKRWMIMLAAAVFRTIDRAAWKHYRHVICISQETKRRVLGAGLAPEEKLEVAHVGLGCHPDAPSDEFDEFFLLPGRIMWTKNIELGISAFIAFKRSDARFANFRLVVAGIVDEKSRSYFARLRELADQRSDIEFRIFPSDEELARLYHTCYAVLFTAFNEDWGIVPLEAMAFGKPVIACDRGGPRETVVNGSNGFLDEPDPEAFARRMAVLASDPSLARQLGRNGVLHSRGYSWATFVGRIDDHLEQIVATQVGDVSRLRLASTAERDVEAPASTG
jgi:glycosyltransferase involved in cell wall biosynthesis